MLCNMNKIIYLSDCDGCGNLDSASLINIADNCFWDKLFMLQSSSKHLQKIIIRFKVMNI